MEEFFLCAFLVGKEMNIVNQQGVHRTIITFQLVQLAILECVHHILDEALCAHVEDFGVFLMCHNGIAYSVQ